VFRDNALLGRLVHALARWSAIAGGLMLIAMTILICVSIIGRAFLWAGLKPILGDYELVSIGMGFAVFAFMPWAHLKRGHALVSLVTDAFGVRANGVILVVTDAMMLVISTFLAWRLYVGMVDKFAYRETTLLLRFSLGWAYALGLIGAVILVVVAIYVLGRSITYAANGEAEPKHAGGEI
jgi:TRAP-type C4-dicarboxylate transport system permease small subunit